MIPWLDALRTRPATAGEAFLITVMHVRGSAPRDPGARMLVDTEGLIGSIGGGRLEHECAQLACAELTASHPNGFSDLAHKFSLGAGLGQCCGGVVEILFERVNEDTTWIRDLLECHEQRRPAVIATEPPVRNRCGKHLVTADKCRTYGPSSLTAHQLAEPARRLLADGGPARRVDVAAADGTTIPVLLEPFGAPGMSIALFGAGHVGSAVVAAMAGLDCEIRWIDTRRRVFPTTAPANVAMIESAVPVREISAMPPGAYYLVMTHSHPMDYEICEAILKRGDFSYVGLIGSRSKRRRFEQRMKKVDMSPALLERLTCPIGVSGVGGKRPAEIAISVAAELLKIKQAMIAVDDGPAENNDNVHVLRRP